MEYESMEYFITTTASEMFYIMRNSPAAELIKEKRIDDINIYLFNVIDEYYLFKIFENGGDDLMNRFETEDEALEAFEEVK
jgi:hypothetical protein